MLQSETVKKYDKYKKSGIEELSKISQENTVRILKNFVRYRGGRIA